jgi:hypothetical protein
MRAPRWFLVSLAIAGCASAGKGNSIVGGLNDGDAGTRSDANDFPAIDASLIDAPPEQITLTQTASSTITRDNSFACIDDVTGLTSQNSYYRVFALDDYGLTTTLHVTQVDFGIQVADAGPGATLQPAQLRIGNYGAAPTGTTLDLAKVRTLATADIKIPNGEGMQMAVPITADVAPGTYLIVELTIPDGSPAGSVFFIGSNAEGERGAGYTKAPAAGCDVDVPTTMQSLATQHRLGEADIIMSITGTRASSTEPR